VITGDAVTATVEVAVDPATAFEVFTAQIGAWWEDAQRSRVPGGRRPSIGRGPGHVGRLRFEPGVGGRLLEEYDEAGAQPFEVGRVLVWKPADRLVFQWRQGNFRPGQGTEVEVRFEAMAGGTRVRLEHRGFAALPADHSARHGLGTGEAFTRMLAGFWSEMLGFLKARAEGDRTRG
jgi:uncharacterized protein YndB with AHSA1/START domain